MRTNTPVNTSTKHSNSGVTNSSRKEQFTQTSREIAKLANKSHNDLLKSIRAMEPAWEKVVGGNFSLNEYTDRFNRKHPEYELSFEECMFIASKFDDVTRAKLVMRWMQLEKEKQKQNQPRLNETANSYKEGEVFVTGFDNITTTSLYTNEQLYSKLAPILRYLDFSTGLSKEHLEKLGDGSILHITRNNSEARYINLIGFEKLIEIGKKTVAYKKVLLIKKELFGINTATEPYAYRFTQTQIIQIYEAINTSPIKKGLVVELLSKGKEGGSND